MTAYGNCETKVTETILTITDICPGSGKGEINSFVNGIALRVFPNYINLIHLDDGDTNEDIEDSNSNIQIMKAMRILKIQDVKRAAEQNYL